MHDLKSFWIIFKNIVTATILQHKVTRVVALGAILSIFAASGFVVLTQHYTASLTRSDSLESGFDDLLSSILQFSALVILFQGFPRLIFNYIQQSIFRRQFLVFLNEYMKRDYISFMKKTPGEMRYLIFIKALASALVSQILIFDFAMMGGTAAFSAGNTWKEEGVGAAGMFIIVPVAYISAVMYFVKGRNKYQEVYLKEQEYVSSKLYDKLLNHEVIKAFNLESVIRRNFYGELDNMYISQAKMFTYEAVGRYLLNVILLIPYICMMLIVLFEEKKDKAAGSFLKLSTLYITLSSQLKSLGKQITDLMTYLYQLKFAEVEDVQEAEESRIEEVRFEESIVFKDVVLLYENTPIVSGINIEIRKGEKIAIVGPNGSGKSTFLKTILGFTRFEGDILIDGRSVRDLNWRSIRRLISYIPQNDYTSDDTVMNNLLLGNPTVTREYIEDKARAFGAHDTFMQLENGYDTHVGPRGNRLSGGQKQKLSLVRAGVRDGAIFVMDEATASMDKKYEKEVFDALFANLKDKTLLMIVHGGEYLKRFDRLIVLNEGQVEDFGTYDKLLRRSKTFKTLISQ